MSKFRVSDQLLIMPLVARLYEQIQVAVDHSATSSEISEILTAQHFTMPDKQKRVLQYGHQCELPRGHKI